MPKIRCMMGRNEEGKVNFTAYKFGEEVVARSDWMEFEVWDSLTYIEKYSLKENLKAKLREKLKGESNG